MSSLWNEGVNMREIHFRGICKDSKRWAYGYYVHFEDFSQGINYHGICSGYYNTHFEVIPETVGQYTGLKDKNNVDVFEGDIVVCNQSGSYGISVIIYDNSAFYVMPLNGNILERTLWDYWYNDWDIEVIGNIHDNPELLKGSAKNE